MLFSKEENKNRTVYISGKITNSPDFAQKFGEAVWKLRELGYEKIINPAILNHWNLDYDQYMNIDFACIEVSDDVFFMEGWEDSPGALKEHAYARYELNKNIIEEGKLNAKEKTEK